MKIIKWMTWYRIDSNPQAIKPFYPATPYSHTSFKLVNYVNGERP